MKYSRVNFPSKACIDRDLLEISISSGDPKGYYATLGVLPSASAEEIKSAFRKLAKDLHPDISSKSDAKTKFQALNEAYGVISDVQARADYDASAYESLATEEKQAPPEPIVCSKCGKVTAQPRYAVYRYVVSLAITTIRNPIQGIFCADCGKQAALKASVISAVAGWWGLPWGPIYTVADIFRNALGGYQPPGSKDRLLWVNTLAFVGLGNFQLAYALAQEVRTSKEDEIAINAVRLLDLLQSNGIKEPPRLLDKWRSSPSQILLHILLLCLIPTIAIVTASLSSPSATGTSSKENSWATMAPPPDNNASLAGPSPEATAPLFPGNSATPNTLDATAPSCAIAHSTGQVLTDSANWTDEANKLSIENGAGGNAIVKIRNAVTGQTLVSFFVANNSTAEYDRIPDGTYRIQYAFGDDLDETCTTFKHFNGAGEFPDTETLSTEYTDAGVSHSILRYTLYGVPGGNVRPQSIDLKTFASP